MINHTRLSEAETEQVTAWYNCGFTGLETDYKLFYSLANTQEWLESGGYLLNEDGILEYRDTLESRQNLEPNEMRELELRTHEGGEWHDRLKAMPQDDAISEVAMELLRLFMRNQESR